MSRAFASFCFLVGLGIIAAGLVFDDGISDRRWLLALGVAWLFLLAGTRLTLPGHIPTFNRSLIRTSLVITTVFILVSAQLVRIQIVSSDTTYNRVAQSADGSFIGNPRIGNAQLTVDRGEIFDRDGELIAGTERDGAVYVRSYPEPATGYVAGYFSPLLYGSSGLEQSFDEELRGQAANNPLDRWVNNLLGRPQDGMNLELSLDADLQRTATGLLGQDSGSIVVMDVETGAVVVLASTPAYDPNRLFTAQPGDNPEATEYWQSLLDDPDAPLVLRPTLGLFTPGSTFKPVIAAIGIEAGYIAPDDLYEDTGELTIDGRVLVERNRPDESRDQWTVAEGLAFSLNVVFAQIGLEIGATDLWNAAPDFGFGADIPFDTEVSTSTIASDREFLSDNNALADTAFGQGQLQMTPLHLAMLTASFCNGGNLMRPYLVERIVNDAGNVTESAEPSVWRTPMSASTATDVQDMMIGAVENGSVSGAQIDGYVVGGKTGTAETGTDSINSLFVGFIGTDQPRYAISVVVEGGGTQGQAVSVGREVLLQTMIAAD